MSFLTSCLRMFSHTHLFYCMSLLSQEIYSFSRLLINTFFLISVVSKVNQCLSSGYFWRNIRALKETLFAEDEEAGFLTHSVHSCEDHEKEGMESLPTSCPRASVLVFDPLSLFLILCSWLERKREVFSLHSLDNLFRVYINSLLFMNVDH